MFFYCYQLLFQVRTTTVAVEKPKEYEQLSYEVKIIPTDQSATLYFHMLGEIPAELFVVKYKEEDDIEFQVTFVLQYSNISKQIKMLLVVVL